MKNIVLLLFAFCFAFSFSQKTSQATVDNLKKLRTTQASSGYFINPPKEIKGSYHIFKEWKNQGIITLTNGDRLIIKNINLNIKDNRYESKINKDSVYAFDSHNIENVDINSRKFKSFYFSEVGKDKIFEIIAEREAFSLLKGYEIDIKINDPDPLMLKPNKDEYVIRYYYYVRRKESIQKFKLSKKDILGLIANEDKKTFESYVKKNNLSYRKEEDLSKMLTDFEK